MLKLYKVDFGKDQKRVLILPETGALGRRRWEKLPHVGPQSASRRAGPGLAGCLRDLGLAWASCEAQTPRNKVQSRCLAISAKIDHIFRG